MYGNGRIMIPPELVSLIILIFILFLSQILLQILIIWNKTLVTDISRC